MNYKLLAIKLGDGLKYTLSVTEINRIAEAVFDFRVVPHGSDNITSVRASLIYSWVMTLAEQPTDDTSKLQLLEEFIRNLTPPDSPLRALARTTDLGESATFWSMIHPSIVDVSKSKFEDGHFADAVESALKEVNTRVKDHVKAVTGRELDGASLMNHAFSVGRPVIKLGDVETESGRSIQQGYMEIFAGSMMGIRNPHAHENVAVVEPRAVHLLFVASLLMHKLDEAGVQ